MERVNPQDLPDGENRDDPWADHPASRLANEPEPEVRAEVETPPAEPERFETAAPEAGETHEQPAEAHEAGYGREREPTPLSAGDREESWHPDGYDDDVDWPSMEDERAAIPSGRGSWLVEEESESAAERQRQGPSANNGDELVEGMDDWEDDRYGRPRRAVDFDDVEEPYPDIARRSSWRPADTFSERKPWEQSNEDGEGQFDGGQPRRRLAGMRPQHAIPVAEESTPLPVTPRVMTPGATRSHRTLIREIVETGLLAILVFLSVRASFQNFKVDGASMQPTLADGEFLIVNKLVYSEIDLEKLETFFPFINGGENPKRNVFHGPERGDIVVLQDPRSPDTDLIKRIIGLPGETLEIVDGKVFVNDFLLEEPYITSEWHDTRSKIAIPEDHYFVMGDNRENSLDSRSQQVGLIHKDLIIGKAMFSYWPKSKFGLAPNGGGQVTDEERPIVTAQRIEEFLPAN